MIHSLLLLAGAALVLLSIFLTGNTKPETDYYHSTVGRARRVEQIAPTQFLVKAEYPLPDGNTAAAEAVFRGSSPPEQGERILVHYNPYSPGEIECGPLPPVHPQFVFFLSILIGGLGFRFFIRYTFRNAKIRVIAEHGKKITPSETAVEPYTLKILKFIRIQTVRIHCRYMGFYEKTPLDFFSEPLPPRREEVIPLEKVRVYYLPRDPGTFFMHTE